VSGGGDRRREPSTGESGVIRSDVDFVKGETEEMRLVAECTGVQHVNVVLCEHVL